MLEPLVSVIVSTRNEEKNIATCLASVKEQTHKNIEIILVDNSSRDRTKEIARQFTDNIHNLGPERSAQRNHGMRVARGEYVMYLDADMILKPDVVAECVRMATRDPELAGLYIPERIVGQGYWIAVRRFERSFYDGTVIDAVRFLPRRVFLDIGGFDEKQCGSEDWDFDKEVRKRGRVGVVNAELQHNEGDFDLAFYLKKKSYYTGTMAAYVAKWGENDIDVRRQLGLMYRYFGVFVENGKVWRLVAHPILTLGMYYLRFRVGMAYLQTRAKQRRAQMTR